MKTLQELLERKAEVISKMEEMLALVEKESRDFTADEETSYNTMETELDGLDKDIKSAEQKEERSKRVLEEKRKLTSVKPMATVPITSNEEEWRNLSEFMYTVAHNPNDYRLQELRVQQMKDGTSGGFAIPSQFRADLMMVDPQAAIVRPRATVIPAGDPPDAEISMPALDQSAAQNMYGGVTVYHQGESDQITESTANLRKVTLKPHKLTAYCTASNELLRNWSASGQVLPQLMRSALSGAEDTDFWTGNGVNRAVGVTQAAAGIDITRAGANAVAWADIYNMVSRAKMGGSLVWVASQTVLPQLIQIADASSRAIWTPSAAPGIPPTLYGYPVMFNERSPALGSKGDLALVDLRYYLIKDGSGPTVAYSEHFRFQNDEGAFRLTWHVDGQPWLNGPIALEGSTANTISPFVILN